MLGDLRLAKELLTLEVDLLLSDAAALVYDARERPTAAAVGRVFRRRFSFLISPMLTEKMIPLMRVCFVGVSHSTRKNAVGVPTGRAQSSSFRLLPFPLRDVEIQSTVSS